MGSREDLRTRGGNWSCLETKNASELLSFVELDIGMAGCLLTMVNPQLALAPRVAACGGAGWVLIF